MRDLTRGPIAGHLLGMAAFIAIGLFFQSAYVLIDLYFVARLGPDAVAGVAAAGNATMLVMAISQLIAVGALALIAQAAGRRDGADANHVFNQALGMSVVAMGLILVAGYGFGSQAVGGVAADAATARFGHNYLLFYLPALAAMFPGAAIGAGLRAAGVVQPVMAVQIGSVLVNAALAPVLIAGWGTGYPFGVAGAGVASMLASFAGLAGLLILLPRVQSTMRPVLRLLWPKLAVWGRLLRIGLPAAGELFMMFLIMTVIYRVIRGFGADAQAGFGIGSRIMQAIFLPAMAVSFAAAPVAGQNFGAGAMDRVRATFWHSAAIGSLIMLSLTLLCQVRPDWLVAPFTRDPEVSRQAVTYLQIMSWNFVGSGLVFACSGVFQGLGDTTPSFISSATRLVTFMLPAFWLAGLPGARLTWIWHLSVASVALQCVTSLTLLWRTLATRVPAEGKVVLF